MSLLPAACGPTARVLDGGSSVEVTIPRRSEAGNPARRTDDSGRVLSMDRESIVATDTLGFERVAAVDIAPVEVRATTRVVAERGGRVCLRFRTVIPAHLLISSTEIELRPVAVAGTDTIPLGTTLIRGQRYSMLRSRELWQAGRWMDRRAGERDSAAAFGRFLHMGLRRGSALDTVRVAGGAMTVETVEWVRVGAASRIDLTVGGRAYGIDSRSGAISGTDTLHFSVSSLLKFADRRTRYLERLVFRFHREQRLFRISFPVGSASLLDTMGSNREEMSNLVEFVREAAKDRETFVVDSVVLSASASPEGSEASNLRLSSLRARSVASRLAAECDTAVARRIRVRSRGEEWKMLRGMLAADPETGRGGILDIIDTVRDADERERRIRTRFPDAYRLIRGRYYPSLRRTSVEIFMQRRAMKQDTVRTEVPDVRYNSAVEALLGRRYREAAAVLGPYRDMNTAVAFLSLGYDSDARDILEGLPVSAGREYLLSVACLRLGLKETARKHVDRAVELDPGLRFRMGLDPEMELLQGHDNDIRKWE